MVNTVLINMNKNSVKCPRCGKEYDLTLKQIYKGVSCPHCNKKMMMDGKTKKRLKYIRYLFVLVVSVATMYPLVKLMKDLDGVTMLIVLGMLAVVFALAQVADKVCGYLLYHTFGFTYVEYVETPVKKDNRTGKKK